MKNCYQLVAPLKTPIQHIGFFPGMQLANANTRKYLKNLHKDFAGYRALLMYRYWEANQITDQV